ncbi:MAG: hypothetical protein AB1512_32365 [Thermodesulfobacteriota bacterium]
MNTTGAVLAARIKSELKELSEIVYRAEQGWERAKRTNDDFYLDGVALNIHGFYSGLELVFEKIASAIDKSTPSGVTWHRDLLDQMSLEIPGVRPAVISTKLKDVLEEYRAFRHVVRNVYTHHLSAEKMKPLIERMRATYADAEKELNEFAAFLEAAQ